MAFPPGLQDITPSPPSISIPKPASLLGGGGGTDQNPDEPDAKSYAAVPSDQVATLLGGDGGLSDLFLNWYANDGTDFRSVFPYQFVITNGGQYVNHISLPLNPQSITMSVNPAVSASVTMKGITEKNNGAPLRAITISGTTGVWNNTLNQKPTGTSNGTLDYLFKNTIQAASGLANQATQLVSALSGDTQTTKGPLNYDAFTPGSTQVQASGYFFFQSLVAFFDAYMARKKTRDGANFRLTFQMHKDKMYYDVLLTGFTWQKKAGTTEYEYSMNFMAYRRRKSPIVGDHLSPTSNQTTRADRLSTLASVINAVRQTRVLLAKSADVLRGIRSDAEDSFFSPMREVILLGSDIAGVLTTLADLPQSIINSAKASFESAVQDTTSSASQLRQAVDTALKGFGLLGDNSVPGSSSLTSKLVVQAADGKSNLAVRAETAFSSEVIFQDPTKYASVFDLVSPNDLTMTDDVRAQVQAELTRVRALQVTDFQQRREKMRLFANSISSALGGTSDTYNKFLGVPPATKTFKQLSVDDIVLLSQINDVVMSIDKLISNIQQAAVSSDNDYYQFYADYAAAAGLAFQKGTSKYFVPFPGNGSLEGLALRYLGDAKRWTEIAALNGLRDPYVDEVGFTVPLIANSSQSSVQVADTYDLSVGQVVTVQSRTKPAVVRKISSIDRIQEGQYLVTLAGSSNLVGYLTQDGAELHAFLPDTVNSTKLIAIPSNSPVNVPGKILLTPGTEDLNALGIVAKVDILLQSDGQVILGANGDVMLAMGMTNLVQAGVMILQTPQGSLLNEPTYGNPISVGDSVAAIDTANYLRQLNAQFQKDSRFTGLLAGRVRIAGPGAELDILVGVRGTRLNLPISSQLPL